jgi:hypothetical protein
MGRASGSREAQEVRKEQAKEPKLVATQVRQTSEESQAAGYDASLLIAGLAGNRVTVLKKNERVWCVLSRNPKPHC